MKVQVNIKIDEELKNAAVEIAEKEHRSLSNFIAYCLICQLREKHGVDFLGGEGGADDD